MGLTRMAVNHRLRRLVQAAMEAGFSPYEGGSRDESPRGLTGDEHHEHHGWYQRIRAHRTSVLACRAQEGADLNVVAINDLTETPTLAHLFKYDSVHGIWPGAVTYHGAGYRG